MRDETFQYDTIPTPLLYGMRMVDGLPCMPDTCAVVDKAIRERIPIQIAAESDYIKLYHVFARRMGAERGNPLVMVKQCVAPSCWLVFVVPNKAEVPFVPRYRKPKKPKAPVNITSGNKNIDPNN